MLTNFDSELFPDDCEVVEIPSHNRWVYLIQKNGSSSLHLDARNNGYRIYKNQEIEALDFVDVYIRDPRSRYISGVNTFVQHLQRDNTTLDKSTCIWMATRYLFMNRHYLPQFHWVLNLSRFLSPSCQIRLHSFDDIAEITSTHTHAGVVDPSPDDILQITTMNNNIEYWFFLDQLLQDQIGKQLSWPDLVFYCKTHPSGVFQQLLLRFSQLNKSLDVLS